MNRYLRFESTFPLFSSYSVLFLGMHFSNHINTSFSPFSPTEDSKSFSNQISTNTLNVKNAVQSFQKETL